MEEAPDRHTGRGASFQADTPGMGAIDRLRLKLTRVVVPTHPSTSEQGHPFMVETYSYERKRRGRTIDIVPTTERRAMDKLRGATHGFSVAENGHSPDGGFMVAVPGNEQILSMPDVNEKALDSYMNAHHEALDNPDTYFGGWVDPKTGKVYLDISVNLDDLEEAKTLGKKNKQIAIFDLNTHQEIRLAREAAQRLLVFLPKDDAKAAYAELRKHLGT